MAQTPAQTKHGLLPAAVSPISPHTLPAVMPDLVCRKEKARP
ncbi:Uncharacterised protein [Kingella potus]|uniref:Uncharacterized protein n=1 Tax=Kingella potus TaxID=265175 RepID=A0A377R219_9NEIS|nr:hypothetical protein [Kingella potus]STR02978.1 Uncharacterised protein [Kingella potus]